MGKGIMGLGALLCMLFGAVAIGCNSEGDSAESSQEPLVQPFRGDSAYIAHICNDINEMMMISTLEIGDWQMSNKKQDVFDGIWLEDGAVVLSVKSISTPLDYVTKGIIATVYPKFRKMVLENLVEKLNARSFVWPKNFFVAVKQNNYKMKFRFWDDSGEKLDIPVLYEDMPEPYKKTPNPLAKKIDGFEAVTIGNQVWMAENLNIEMDSSVCYNHNPEKCDQFGRLYNYNSAIKACPNGWHLPDSTEMEELFITAEKALNDEISKNHELDSIVENRYTVNRGSFENGSDKMTMKKVHQIGLMLMSSNKQDGESYGRTGMNYLGFNMKAAGKAEYYGSSDSPTHERFEGLTGFACLWTSFVNEEEHTPFWEKHLYLSFLDHSYNRSGPSSKCSVRCIQDKKTTKE